MRRRRRKQRQASVEMQMGPMIDMVFLLLVFFMVTAKPIQPEADIPIGLPGALAQDEPVDIPEELFIELGPDGTARVNEQRLTQPALAALLIRFKEAAVANRSEVLVTLAPHDDAPHQRIVDVLDACAEAGIGGVSFAEPTSEF